MATGVHGRLVSASFARAGLEALPGLSAVVPGGVARGLRLLGERVDALLGPASGVRAITDVSVVPLLDLLGYTIAARDESSGACRVQTRIGSRPGPAVVIVNWDAPLDRAWRAAVNAAIVADADWCFCANGRLLRVVDGRRTWSRQHLEFDLRALAIADDALAMVWRLLRAEAMAASPPLLTIAAAASARHGVEVSRALGDGVLHALTLLLDATTRPPRTATTPGEHFEHALTVLYRVLFLLFAEARGLVPTWHPIYRDRYSLEAIVATLMEERACRGLWTAVQAISRMAHAGCSAGELKVNAFNGRLFAPSSAALEQRRIDDHVMRGAILAVSTTRDVRHSSRTRIAYRDLDVEQLGAVYERVLDYEPAGGGTPAGLVRTRDVRKSTASFYTPRAVTAFLVRRTLGPLVEGRSAAEILALRIVDPAMGSGAFLVAACRFLASAVEDALIREGTWHPSAVTAADRVGLRRQIALRCLYGVDLNPTAVQLARLSLWLATLAADKPLSFLDHHLVTGNSLIGASLHDLARQPSRGATGRRQQPLPLLTADLDPSFSDAAAARRRLAEDPDETAAIVRGKEQVLAALRAPGTPIDRWSRALDLWCAGWFWNDGAALDRATFGELVGLLIGRRSTLPERFSAPLLAAAAVTSARVRFLHWPLAFPEVFAGPSPGFDAVIGNPPWDMIRGDSGAAGVRDARRQDARDTLGFVRESGVYRVDSGAHINRYQLFVERALQLVRHGGRIGLVLPSGAMADSGAAGLRRHLFDRADVDSITGLDNRGGIFPIHRGVRFMLLTCTAGRPTSRIQCRFGISNPDHLDGTATGATIEVSRALLSRLSGEDDLGLPELASDADLRIVERVSAHVPRLGSDDGWGVRFGRELNASDDRDAFRPVSGTSTARPVVEGKAIEPFRVDLASCRTELPIDAPESRRVPRRSRLAYRDVASATNRVTLIAAIIPSRAVTTHTLFCLRTPLPIAEQQVLCGLMNSVVANYLVRLRVNTHVTVALVSRLPMPVVRPRHPEFGRLLALTTTLMHGTVPAESMPEYAELQARVAALYGLTTPDFAHILNTFPLIPQTVRDAALVLFNGLT